MLRKLVSAAVLSASSLALPAAVNVKWQSVENRLDAQGNPEYVQRFIVSGDMSNLCRLAFNQFDRTLSAITPGDTVVRIIPAYFYISSPRFHANNGQDVVVDIVSSGTLNNFSFGPDGVHGIDHDGKPFNVTFTRDLMSDRPEQYSLPGKDRMPYGDAVFAINEKLATDFTPSAYDILPSFKSVKVGKGVCTKLSNPKTKLIKNANPEFYRLKVTPGGVTIEGASEKAIKIGRHALERLAQVNKGKLPAATVEDWPDHGYRGMMIDVARNWQSLPQMKKFVKLLADYRMNTLHFHFIDDEGWRLEIPGLPELTEVGSRRGYTTDEKEFLGQTYAGDGLPNSDAIGNGHVTRKEFVDFLKYCDSLGITVVPEVETPGHARAAVKAMEARYRKTGDPSMRLREDGDNSEYTSAQDYHDNVMNPALAGPYNFMGKVFDEIIAMYKEAGAPLATIHIGGDEVPHGAWSGSPSAIKFMKEKGWNEGDLQVYWGNRLADMLVQRGLKISGWQDIALGKNDDIAREMAPKVEFVNLWVTWPHEKGEELPATNARRLGIPVVISSADGYYFDLSYDRHPEERGLWWAGVCDELKSFNTYPSKIAPGNDGAPVVGVSGQLWSETVRGPKWMEYYLFPKMLGLVERAWNGDTTYTAPQFSRIVDRQEMPWLDSQNVNYRMRQAGIRKAANGKIEMNSPYPGAVIRYTTDGTEPTAASPAYKAPFAAPAGTKEVRARLYYRGKESVATHLKLQ